MTSHQDAFEKGHDAAQVGGLFPFGAVLVSHIFQEVLHEMKKNLLVMLVVGLMVALLGAPAFATDGHDDGHGTGTITSADVLDALEYTEDFPLDAVDSEDSNILTITPNPIFDEVDSDDPIFQNLADLLLQTAIADGAQDIDLIGGAFDATIASEDNVLHFVTVTMDGVDRVFLFVSPDQWVQADLSGGVYGLGGASLTSSATEPLKIDIYDNSEADADPASGSISFGFIAAHEEPATNSGSGGGCDLLAIAPMAGLLVLPLMLLVKR